MEIADHCRALYGTFDGFALPLEVSFTVQLFPEGTPVPTTVEEATERTDAIDVTLTDSDGVELDALLDAFRPDESLSPYVGRIDFEDISAYVRVDSGDVYASRNVATVEYKAGEPSGNEPYFSPLLFDILLHPEYENTEVQSDKVYVFQVKSKTDVWFGECEAARVNGKRLSAFLGRIEDALPVGEVKRWTNRDLSKPMTDIF